MPNRPGAIIRVIYRILDSTGRVSGWFNEGFIVQQYNELKNRKQIKRLIEAYKKHNRNHDIKTLVDPASLKAWLRKHSEQSKYKKEIIWFQHDPDKGFKLIQETITKIRAEHS